MKFLSLHSFPHCFILQQQFPCINIWRYNNHNHYFSSHRFKVYPKFFFSCIKYHEVPTTPPYIFSSDTGIKKKTIKKHSYIILYPLFIYCHHYFVIMYRLFMVPQVKRWFTENTTYHAHNTSIHFFPNQTMQTAFINNTFTGYLYSSYYFIYECFVCIYYITCVCVYL